MDDTRGAYRDDLAYIHDAGFLAWVNSAAPAVLSALRKNGIRRGLVVDVGCGTGVLAAKLTAARFDVLGIDISPAMIAIARQRAPRATFSVGSLYRAELPRCRAVMAIGECLNYAFDPRSTEAGLAGWFRRVHRALEPGGMLIFDMAVAGAIRRKPAQRHVVGEDWAVLVDLEERAKPAQLIRRITTYRKVGARYRRAIEIHRLHLHRRAKLHALLRGCGFRVSFGRAYGKRVLPPGHVVVIARKPPD